MNEILAAVELVSQVRSATGVSELRSLFLSALDQVGVKYCLALAVESDPEGAPQGAVIIEKLPISAGFEQISKKQPDFLPAVTSIVQGHQSVEIFTKSAESLGAPFRELFFDQEARWCLLVPVLQAGQVSGIGFFYAKRRLAETVKEALVALSKVAFERASAAGIIPSAVCPLTLRQREVLAYCADGKSDWEIGQLLGISRATAHEHVESAKRKLGVRTRVQAVAVATQRRWI